jgi:hypothetical protein
MNTLKEKSFEEMSNSFKEAYGYSLMQYYRRSILLYVLAIKDDPNNFSSWNNLTQAKVYVAIEDKNVALIEEAIADFTEAIRITEEVYKFKGGYPISAANRKWAQEHYEKIK